jgi:hypothetical protein
MRVWHPIIESEQITIPSLQEALTYWKSLAPINQRWNQTGPEEVGLATATREELVTQRILREEAFSKELEEFWQRLKERVAAEGENGKILYQEFVYAETYEETVDRAFMTSFLVTYGYATLRILPLEDEIYIVPLENPVMPAQDKQLVSIPIAITAEEWQKAKKEG